MKNICIGGYKRISKTAARKLYNAGKTIRICACNFSPVNIWGAYSDASPDKYTNVSNDGFNTTVARNKEFDTVVNAFTFYNCINSETGKYPAFYVKGV